MLVSCVLGCYNANNALYPVGYNDKYIAIVNFCKKQKGVSPGNIKLTHLRKITEF